MKARGRGFSNRLLPYLAAQYEKLCHVSLSEPIRYAPQDCLENHLTEVFLLTDCIQPQAPLNTNSMQVLNLPHQAIACSQYLEAAVRLLANAHYKTTPEDIMRMCDMPDTQLVCVVRNEQVIATALLIEEGGDSLSALSQLIACGERRLKGHLLAQSLALYSANPTMATLKYWRINRIAVSKDSQNQGIGSLLMRHLNEHARRSNIDFICSSFGATPTLLNFWLANGFFAVKLGSKPDAASGEASVSVVRPVSARSAGYVSPLRALCHAELDNRENLLHDSSVLRLIRQHVKPNTAAVKLVYQARVLDYVNGNRSSLHMGNAVQWWLGEYMAANTLPSLLKRRWIDKAPDQVLCQEFGFKGRKALFSALDDSFADCYWQL